MLNIQTILTAVVDGLKSIPELVALVQSPDNIVPYADDYSEYRSFVDAMDSMPVPSILVGHDETALTTVGGSDFPRWCHRFVIVFRLERTSESMKAIELLINGMPDAQAGSPWIAHDILDTVYPPSDIAISKVKNADGTELYQLSFLAVEIGG